MGQQSVAEHKKRAGFDRLFISPCEMDEYVRSIFDLITRRAYEIFASRGNGHGHDWEDWFKEIPVQCAAVCFN